MARRAHLEPLFGRGTILGRQRMSFRAAVLVGLVVLLSGGLTQSWAVSGAALDQGSFDVLDKLPLFEPGPVRRIATLILDPTARRGYQITRKGVGSGGQTLQTDVFGAVGGQSSLDDIIVWSFDLDSLKPIRRIVIEKFSPAAIGGLLRDGDLTHAVDEQRGRIYLAGLRQGTGGVLRPAVAVIDEAKLDKGATDAVTFMNAPETQLPQLTGRVVWGMALRRVANRAKLVLLATTDLRNTVQTVNDSPPRDHYLVQWDAEPGPGGVAQADWTATDGSLTPSGNLAANGTYRLGSCQAAALLPTNAGWAHAVGILPHSTGIYLGCQGTGLVMLAVRVSLDAGGRPTGDRPFPFPRVFANVLADVEGGRLLFETSLAGSTWVAFDAASHSYVGTAGLLQGTGHWTPSGLDPRTGRLYTLSPHHVAQNNLTVVQGGLMASDTRLTPVPQFTNMRPDLAYPGHTPIRVDPAAPGRNRKLFVRRGISEFTQMAYPTRTQVNTPPEDFYLVIRDTVPVAEQPVLASFDANTVPVPEEAGVAEATYEGNASGFGFRSLLIGGFNAVAGGEYNSNAPTSSDCYRTDRETILGLARSVRLSSLVASGSGSSFDVDPTLKADLERPATRCWPFSSQPPTQNHDRDPGASSPTQAQPTWQKHGAPLWEQFRPRWDDADYEVECIGSDGEKHTTIRKAALEFSATVTCRQEKEEVSMKAVGETAGAVEGVVSVAHASSKATTRRDPKKGLVATVDSVARGVEITLGDTRVSIGLIRTEAESVAAGLPGTATTNARDGLKRTICGVHAPGFDLRGCTTDVRTVVTQLNSQLTRYGEFRLREPDPAYAQGSPGGYLAAVQRDRAQAFNDRVVTRDNSNAVPGLEFIVWRSDHVALGAGRQVFQFAAVEAATAYGISCVRGARPDGKGCLGAPPPDVDVPDNGDFEASGNEGSLVEGGGGDLGDTDLDGGSTTSVTRTGRDGSGGGGLGGVIRRIARLPVEGLKLLFSSPREMGLMAAVWALLWLPCYLGERRRLVAAMAGRST